MKANKGRSASANVKARPKRFKVGEISIEKGPSCNTISIGNCQAAKVRKTVRPNAAAIGRLPARRKNNNAKPRVAGKKIQRSAEVIPLPRCRGRSKDKNPPRRSRDSAMPTNQPPRSRPPLQRKGSRNQKTKSAGQAWYERDWRADRVATCPCQLKSGRPRPDLS